MCNSLVTRCERLSLHTCHLHSIIGEASIQFFCFFLFPGQGMCSGPPTNKAGALPVSNSLVLCIFKIMLLLFLLLSLGSSLHILDNSPLSYLSFANISSQSVAYLIFLTLSFTEQKFLILTRSNSSIVSITDQTFSLHLKLTPHPRSCSIFLKLSFRSLVICVLHLGLEFILREFLWRA